MWTHYKNERRTAVICSKIGLCDIQFGDISKAKEYFNEALMREAWEPFSLFLLARIRWIEDRPDLSKNGAEEPYRQLESLIERK